MRLKIIILSIITLFLSIFNSYGQALKMHKDVKTNIKIFETNKLEIAHDNFIRIIKDTLKTYNIYDKIISSYYTGLILKSKKDTIASNKYFQSCYVANIKLIEAYIKSVDRITPSKNRIEVKRFIGDLGYLNDSLEKYLIKNYKNGFHNEDIYNYAIVNYYMPKNWWNNVSPSWRIFKQGNLDIKFKYLNSHFSIFPDQEKRDFLGTEIELNTYLFKSPKDLSNEYKYLNENILNKKQNKFIKEYNIENTKVVEYEIVNNGNTYVLGFAFKLDRDKLLKFTYTSPKDEIVNYIDDFQQIIRKSDYYNK